MADYPNTGNRDARADDSSHDMQNDRSSDARNPLWVVAIGMAFLFGVLGLMVAIGL